MRDGPPRSVKRRRPNRERRGSSAEFVILADDGEQHVVQAVDPPYESDHVDTTHAPNLGVKRSRTRDDAVRSGDEAATLSSPRSGVLNPSAEREALGIPPQPLPGDPDAVAALFGLRRISPAIPTVEDHQPVNTLERPPATPTEARDALEARIAVLEVEDAALRHDNAALGVSITESNNIRRNDEGALFALARTTDIPRGTLLRLLDNDDFLEWWRLGSRHGGSGAGRSRSSGRGNEQVGAQLSGSSRSGSGRSRGERGGSGHGRSR